MQKNKLLNYSACAASMVALASGSEAQINYTDLDPDTVLTIGDTVMLDINTDMTDDLRFNATQASGTGFNVKMASVQPLNNASVVVTSGNWHAHAFSQDDTINKTASFYGNYVFMGYALWTTASSSLRGEFIGEEDKYLGYRIFTGSDTLYGWVRLDVSAEADTIIIKDYAYHTVNNAEIRAGQTVVTGNENNPEPWNDVIVYSSGKTVYLHSSEGINNVMIYNVSGMLVKQQDINNSRGVIALNSSPPGVYFAQIASGKGIITRKRILIE